MKRICQVSLLLLLHLVCHAQQPLVSLVGRYERDDPKNDPTDYEGLYAPCLKENITSSVGFRGYDERQDWQGLGEAYYYLKFNSSGTCAATNKAGLTKPVIMMDGFDPLDSRSPAKIYGKYLSFIGNTGNLLRLGNFLRDGVNPTNTSDTFGKFDIVVLNFPRYRRGGLVSQTYPCPIPATYVPRPGQPTREQLCQQAGYPRTVTFGPPEQVVDGGADCSNATGRGRPFENMLFATNNPTRS